MLNEEVEQEELPGQQRLCTLQVKHSQKDVESKNLL